MIATITVPYPPPTNRMYRNCRGRTVLSTDARKYKEQVRAARGGSEPHAGPVIVSLDVYRPRRSGDLDGRIKCLLDALEGVLYLNDNQVVEIHARRFDDKRNPRVEVEVVDAG